MQRAWNSGRGRGRSKGFLEGAEFLEAAQRSGLRNGTRNPSLNQDPSQVDGRRSS